jgi:SAM-dependent methyltransferase
MDRAVAALTKVLLDLAAAQPGERVLDIGCGPGTTVLELTRRVGPGGHMLGADVFQPSVARARERIATAGLRHAEAIVADASVHPFTPDSFELAFSRFGIMFFSDPVVAFENVRRAMKPGGRLAVAVFRAASKTLWPNAPLEAVRHLLSPIPTPGPEEPGPFSWADPARVHRILEGAGRRDRVYSAAGGVVSAGRPSVVAGRAFGGRGEETSNDGRAGARRAEPGNLAGAPPRSLAGHL